MEIHQVSTKAELGFFNFFQTYLDLKPLYSNSQNIENPCVNADYKTKLKFHVNLNYFDNGLTNFFFGFLKFSLGKSRQKQFWGLPVL